MGKKLLSTVVFALVIRAYGFYGVISTDTTWSDTVYITGDVVVSEYTELNIEPGTVVILGVDTLGMWSEWDTTGGSPTGFLTFVDIIVYGEIHSEGTETDSIRFEPHPTSWPPGEYVIWGGIYINWSAYDLMKSSSFSYTVIEGSYLGISAKIDPPGGGWDIIYIKNSHIANIHPFRYFHTCCCGDSGISAYGILASNVSHVEIEDCSIENIEAFPGECGDNWYQVAGGDGGDAYGIKLENLFSCTINNNLIDGVRGGKGGNYYFNPPGTLPPTVGWSYDCPSDYSSGGGYGGNAYGIYVGQISRPSLISSNSIAGVAGGKGGDDEIGEGSPGGEATDLYLSPECANFLLANNEFQPAQGGAHGNDSVPYGLSKGIVIAGTQPVTVGGSMEDYNTILGSDYALVNLCPEDINATYNFWGTNDPTMIDSLIWDCVDDSSVGCVDYVPWLYGEDISQQNLIEKTGLNLSSKIVRRNLRISWSVASEQEKGELKLIDVRGRVVTSRKVRGRGVWELDLNELGLSSGIYFVKLRAGEENQTVKFIHIRASGE